jgi:kynurenine formamidase
MAATAFPKFVFPKILYLLLPLLTPLVSRSAPAETSAVIDLSLLVSEDLPATWPAPGWPFYVIQHNRRIGPLSPYNSDILMIDGNTGTQLDVPPHSIPRPGSKLPDAGPFGAMYTDKAPPWQFGGEACVIDVRNLLDKGARGRSRLIQKKDIVSWEKQHRPLRAGDAVLFYSGYSDRSYKAFPA